jgi:small subunit ribosomal protein S1
MSSVAGVRASVPVPRSTRVSQPRKLNGPRVVTARAITQTVAETPNANAALYDQFKALLVDYEFSYKIGDRVSGKVFHCDSKGAWVDIGAKAAALCPAEESSLADVRNAAAVFDVGEEYEFEIIKDDDGDGSLTLSIRKIQLEAAWDRCRDQQANDEAVNSMVLSVNRGGLLVEVEHLRGFVPQSHIAVRVTNREDLVGQLIPVKFLEVDEEKNRLVMSNRLATDMVSGEGLGVGDVVTGVVQAVKPYGAFVDVGGVSGLLHISQISHDRIVAVENVLAPGDELKVLILSKDADRSRLSLSTKKLEPSPGDMLRNPALVFEKAEEMGRLFRERVAAAEAAAQAEEGAGSEMAGMAPAKAESTDDEEA